MSYILLISGPSGAGKSSLLSRLFAEFKDEIYFSLSSTTRAPRAGELDGVHYHFISEAEFQKGIEEDAFLEWARVHTHFYGSSKKLVSQALKAGKVVIFDIDVQGFLSIKDRLELSSIFITSPSKKELEKRLLKRGTDSTEAIKKRLEVASEEMNFLAQYDFCIINESLERSYEQLRAIFLACKNRVQSKNVKQIQHQWYKGD